MRCCLSRHLRIERHPLNFQVGYYTTVGGPRPVSERCLSSTAPLTCTTSAPVAAASLPIISGDPLSNLTINVSNPTFGCYTGEFWAVSQACAHSPGAGERGRHPYGLLHRPILCERRLHRRFRVRGRHHRQWIPAAMDHSEQPDRWLDQRRLESGLLRRRGRACPVFPPRFVQRTIHHARNQSGNPRRALCVHDSNGNYNVFVPSVQFNSGRYKHGPTARRQARPSQSRSSLLRSRRTPRRQINAQLFLGKNLILTPGIYNLNQTLLVTRPDTVVLGIGFPTLIPENGIVSMIVLPAQGVMVSGMIFDAGIPNSPLLLQFGTPLGQVPALTPLRCRMSFSGLAARSRARPTLAFPSAATTPSWMTSGPGAPTTATASVGPTTPPTLA